MKSSLAPKEIAILGVLAALIFGALLRFTPTKVGIIAGFPLFQKKPKGYDARRPA